MIYAISDLHISLKGDKPMNIFGSSWDNYLQEIKADWLSKVSFDDIVLLCGDLSWAKDLDEAIFDMSFFTSLPGRKIIIKGNHEYWWTSYSKVKLALPENVFAIQNNALSMENYVFCGTRGWDILQINRRLSEIESELKQIQGTLNTYDSLIDYSKVTINFDTPTTVEKETFGSKLGDAYKVGLGVAENIFIFVLVVLPFAAVIGGIVVLSIFLSKKQKAKKKAIKTKESEEKLNAENNTENSDKK